MDTAPRIIESDQSWEKWKGIDPNEAPEYHMAQIAPMVGEVAVRQDEFWKDGIEPDWFCFSD